MKSRQKRRRRILSAVIGGGLLAAGAVPGIGYWRYSAPGPLPETKALVIPPGGYASTIAALQEGGALRNDMPDVWIFRAAIALTRREGQLHAAELQFPAYGSMRDLLNVLRHGQPVRHPITIPEGLAAKQILTVLNEAPLLSGKIDTLPEGDVLPQTYYYLRNTGRGALVARMKLAMQRAVSHVWENRDPSAGLQDPEQMVILASIVEKETGLPAERPHVARVFLNRLRLGMKLQADPTTIYALTDGAGRLGRALTHADMGIQSPYNTYVTAGLPPTPICSPGLASLEAVAHPAPGDDLYFVAAGDGTHRFTPSLNEHNRNVSALRTVRGSGADMAPSVTHP
ncbi:endolytic transglycosylase MltG [Acetobacter musti]|uniref:endolytic transglycosylase MltG n=1 Tax=Acetobacter musti TaxID=864732 RepID=UPI00156A73DB